MSVPVRTHTIQGSREATRDAILEAAAALFLEHNGGRFSVQEVADRAGLTHRTVYRYFPARQDLLGSTARILSPGVEDAFLEISSVQEWIDALGPRLAATEANLGVVRSVLAATLASEELRTFARSLPDRDAHRWRVFRRQFPHLSDHDARRTFATLRHMTSSASYVLYRLRFRMSPAEAVDAVRSGALQIVEQAKTRDRAAAAGTRE